MLQSAGCEVRPADYLKRTEFVLAGLTKAQISAQLTQVVTRKELPVLEAGSMFYMMAKGSYLGDDVAHWHPHFMFYGSRSDGRNTRNTHLFS